jgi:uncharacterized coiled-coil DUF342 family protein|tara:strand:+ start:976 stop:1209 length:234 start_codon:yes stop_codon:yes gene_type:complete
MVIKKKINYSPQIGFRLSSHEKICAERMKTLFKSIDELKKEVKEMRADMNKGKGAVNFLLVLGGLAGVILGFLKWNG